MSNFERILKRTDGTEARILILDFTSPFSKGLMYEVCIFTREIGDRKWSRINDTYERKMQAKTQSVSEFVKHGRNPIFSIVTIGEILKTIHDWSLKG